MSLKKVVVTGAQGQLGQALSSLVPDDVQLIACSRKELDICDAEQVDRFLAQQRPDVVINAAAYTAVDKAESEPDLARAINTDGARNITAASIRHGAWPIQISTDFVFDGMRSSPYPPDAQTNPLGVYGLTKRDGEIAVREAGDGQASIVRTAWVYGPVGQNFMLTMRRLLQEREELRVVSDQVGTPTSTHSISRALFAMIKHDLGRGEILHWTDAGVGSWFDFACRVRECLLRTDPQLKLASIDAIPTHAYPTPARRPAMSVLQPTDHGEGWPRRPHWADEVCQMLDTCLQ